GYLDGIRESEKKEERFNEPDQSAMQAVAEKLDETVLAGTGAQIRSDQATATDNGSAKSIREVWKKEEAEEQAANAAKEEQKQTSLLARIAGSSEEHKNLFGGIFGPKGKIAMLLMLAIPAVIAFFKNDGLRNLLFEGMEWLFKKITDNLPTIATTLAGAIAGAIPTIVQNIPKIFNFAANGLETVVNAFRRRNGGGKNGTGYQVDENGTIIRDENGVPISNDAREGRGFFETIRDTIFPTVTRIDPKTGRAENLRTSDGFSEILTHHGARIGTKMGIRAYRLAKPVVKAGIAGVKGAVHGVKAAGSYLASAGKYSKALGFMHRMGAEKGLAQQGAATLAGGNKGKLLGTAMNYVDEAVSATANRIKNSSIATKAVGYVDDVGKRLASTKTGSAVTKVASKGGGIIKQFIKIAKEGIEFLTTKLTEFMTKHGAKKGAETGVLATIKKLTSTLSETTLGKFAGKITSAVGSFVAGLSPATVANIAFAGLAFINANPAQVFNVDKSAVDWKMQLIARTMKALLGTSFGMIFDVLFEIANSLFGFDIGKEICVGLYNAISGEKDEADLKKAKEEFDAEWRQYQDTEYEAYCQHELQVGNTP
ncbi:hypothetical protein, partial [Turicimonas muris]|uniref:hypothetical protein n=1 Tax=Turicimonas muris TaxID=1796652 RepID=UPI00260C0454